MVVAALAAKGEVFGFVRAARQDVVNGKMVRRKPLLAKTIEMVGRERSVFEV